MNSTENMVPSRSPGSSVPSRRVNPSRRQTMSMPMRRALNPERSAICRIGAMSGAAILMTTWCRPRTTQSTIMINAPAPSMALRATSIIQFSPAFGYAG